MEVVGLEVRVFGEVLEKRACRLLRRVAWMRRKGR